MDVTRKQAAAAPALYLILGIVAAFVQWSKWHAVHRTRNLLAALVATLIVTIAAIYLGQALRAREPR